MQAKQKLRLALIVVLIAFGGGLAAYLGGLFGPAHSDHRILRVGAHIPMTNESVLVWGTWARQGIDLAVDPLAAEGIQLQVEYSDDKNDVRGAQEAAARFLREDRFVLAAYLSRASTAIAPLAKDNDALLLTNTYTPDIVAKAPGYVFRVGQNAATDSRAMAKFCAEHLGKKSLSIIHLRTPAGQEASDVLIKEYRRLGGVANEPVVTYEASETDYRAKLLQVKSQNPGIVYFYAYDELGTLMKVAREVGITADLCTDDVAEVPDFFPRAGEAGNGVYYTALPFDPKSTDPAVQAFTERFRNRYSATPDVHAATWYDTMMIVGRAYKQSDGSRAGLRQAILDTQQYRGITGVISFRPDGDVDREVAVKVTRNRTYQLWKKP